MQMGRTSRVFSRQGRGSCDAVTIERIAQEWFEGLCTCAGGSFAVDDMRPRFDIWTDQFFRVLESDPFNPHVLRAIGAELALFSQFSQAQPEVLGITLRVLGSVVATRVSLHTPSMLFRLAEVIGELSAGFTATTYDVILSQQEQRQCLHFTTQVHGAAYALMPKSTFRADDGGGSVCGLSIGTISGFRADGEVGARLSKAATGVSQGEGSCAWHRPMAVVPQREPVVCQRQCGDFPIALSMRELEVLQLVARGYTNQHIAMTLCVAEGTVKNHITHIYTKLAVRSRAEAVAWAWQQGLWR